MNNRSGVYAAVTAILGWFAVIMQLYLIIKNRPLPLAEVLIEYVSYFTILTNILVAVWFSSIALYNDENSNRFFLSPGVQTAITVYILVVGATYNLILRFLWAPEGLQKLVDELLHSVVPLLALIYWCIFVPKKSLQYKNSFSWMWFPFAYIIYIAIRGAVSGKYPYPFIDVNLLGYPRTLLNALGLVLVFMGLSLFLIAVAQWREKTRQLKA